MIGREEILGRIERVRAAAERRGWDGLLVVGRSFYDRVGHLAYLSNHFPPFPASPFVGNSRGLGHGLLLIPVHGPPTLLVDGRAYRRDLVAIDDVRADNDLVQSLIDLLTERGLGRGRLGLVGEDLFPRAMDRPLQHALPSLVLESADDVVASARTIKSANEIALLRQAAEIAGRGLEAARATILPGLDERAVCAAGTGAALAAGADFIRYLRVHSGPWAGMSSRWPQATDRQLVTGDLVTLDIIGAYQGYQFDVLRSTAVGPPSDEARRILDAGLRATEVTLAAVGPGVPVRELVKQALVSLDNSGFGSYASGFVGHGIGLETVEEPYIQSGSDAVLAEGMVICIEPSIRIPNQAGCSIEQEVVVTRDGFDLLTTEAAKWW